jgi:uncharacterized protein
VRSDFRLVGVLHLPPLPGAGNYQGQPISEIAHRAAEDAASLAEAGFTDVMIQNANDVPQLSTVDLGAVAVMTRIGTEVRSATSIPVGVTVGHNDGPAALAVAAAIGASFIRVKVLTGARVGPQGLLVGCAVQTARMQQQFGSAIEIWADVNEATSQGLVETDVVWSAREAVKFGGADRLIVTRDSGVEDALRDIQTLRPILPETPMIVGGRVTANTVSRVRDFSDGAILGAAIKTEHGTCGRVDARRAEKITNELTDD